MRWVAYVLDMEHKIKNARNSIAQYVLDILQQ